VTRCSGAAYPGVLEQAEPNEGADVTSELTRELMAITRRFAEGDVDGALEAMARLEGSCRTDAERSLVMSRYASFFHVLDLREEELAAIARALALDPCNPRARYLNALQLMIDERWDEAITELHRAARYYAPDDGEHLAEVYGNLSYCWGQLGDRERSAMYDELCADLDPEGVPVPAEVMPVDWEEPFEVEPESVLERGVEGEGVGDGAGEVELPRSERIDEMLRELRPRHREAAAACRGRRRERRRRRGVVETEPQETPRTKREAVSKGSRRTRGSSRGKVHRPQGRRRKGRV